MRHRGRGEHYRQVTGDIQQAIILVGGRGTRLGELTQQTPKPLLPVAGRPFIDYWLDKLAAVGIADIILACGHLAQHFIERYDRKKWQGAQIRACRRTNPPAPAVCWFCKAGFWLKNFFYSTAILL